jgi:hypothetical protein
MTYAIQFNYPEGECYADIHKGAFGWAPTLKTAMSWDDPEDAARVLANAYGGEAAKWGEVIPVPDSWELTKDSLKVKV